MKTSYINYAMSVIIGRAIPDVRDGLKPVHRRSLYGMWDMGNTSDKPTKKSARVVGDVMGKYHPHGDASIYDTIVKMAQPFSYRHMLVQGQGNFGSVDGDSAAASRYTEVRLFPYAEALLEDLDKETVKFIPNYDESLQEPTVLPAKIPNLLVNGTDGIAVGMATKMPPHNLREVCDAVEHYLDNPEISVEELVRIMPGPDFPTGGIMMGVEGVKNYYATGQGRVIVRGVAKSRSPMAGTGATGSSSPNSRTRSTRPSGSPASPRWSRTRRSTASPISATSPTRTAYGSSSSSGRARWRRSS